VKTETGGYEKKTFYLLRSCECHRTRGARIAAGGSSRSSSSGSSRRCCSSPLPQRLLREGAQGRAQGLEARHWEERKRERENKESPKRENGERKPGAFREGKKSESALSLVKTKKLQNRSQ